MAKRNSGGVFDISKIKTYPLKSRKSRMDIDDFVNISALQKAPVTFSAEPWYRNGIRGGGKDQSEGIAELAQYIVKCRKENKPVVVITGAHPVKNGQAPIFIDLIERGIITLFATNGAGSIHSFELALTGASSEAVRDALPKGEFGMAFETGAYINFAIKAGVEKGYGYGESMGRLIADDGFRKEVLSRVFKTYRDTGEYYVPRDGFAYPQSSIFAAALKKSIPCCVHATIGTDIIDQHPSFDGAAKGAASAKDFLLFTEEMCRFTKGGVVLNIGAAITGPEVLLKAVSMAANVGKKPDGLWTADFDIRPFVFDDSARDEAQYYYYLRDQKSVATRIPKVFGGVGFYFQGLHQATLPPLYQQIVRSL